MAKADEVSTTEQAPQQETRTEIRVGYTGPADVRILTSEELDGLGVTHKDPIRWDRENDKSFVLSKTNSEALVKALPTEFSIL